MSVTIWRPGSALEQCSVCHMQRQFHDRASEPHDFVAMTLADFDPEELSPEQLSAEIFRAPHTPRAVACGQELRRQVKAIIGVDWDDLQEALA